MYNFLVLLPKVYKIFVQLSREIKRKMENFKNNIANNIKYYRKLLNLTQEQLANFLNGKNLLFPSVKIDKNSLLGENSSGINVAFAPVRIPQSSAFVFFFWNFKFF